MCAKWRSHMLNRRTFMKETDGGMAGVLLVGRRSGEARGSLLQSGSASRRRQVLVGGRRVKTVDFHAHCAFPEVLTLTGIPPNSPDLLMAPERLRWMDEQGIDVQV